MRERAVGQSPRLDMRVRGDAGGGTKRAGRRHSVADADGKRDQRDPPQSDKSEPPLQLRASPGALLL